MWGTPKQDEWLSYCNSASAQSTCQIMLAHPDSITDKLASRKIHHEVQLCQMKGQWQKAKADEWQANADKHHMCLFYDGLKGGLWTKTEHDNADHNQREKCADHRLPRHKGPTLSIFV